MTLWMLFFPDTTDRRHTDHFSGGGSWINQPGGLSGSGDGDHPETAGDQGGDQRGVTGDEGISQHDITYGGEDDQHVPIGAEGGNDYVDAIPVCLDVVGPLNHAEPDIQPIDIPSDEEPSQSKGMFLTVFRTILLLTCLCSERTVLCV